MGKVSALSMNTRKMFAQVSVKTVAGAMSFVLCVTMAPSLALAHAEATETTEDVVLANSFEAGATELSSQTHTPLVFKEGKLLRSSSTAKRFGPSRFLVGSTGLQLREV